MLNIAPSGMAFAANDGKSLLLQARQTSVNTVRSNSYNRLGSKPKESIFTPRVSTPIRGAQLRSKYSELLFDSYWDSYR